MAQSYEGFGGSSRGGVGQPIYLVTNLNDAGPGSLREAVSQGNRQVVFEVAGDIQLQRDIYVHGAFVTIEGGTAPSPGITLKNRGLLIHGLAGAHDIIVRHIRLRDSVGCDTCDTSGAGIGISRDAYNVLVDHVSVQGAQDQDISVGRGAHDVTIQWSIFAEGKGHNLPILIAGVSRETGAVARRVTMHHNLFIKGAERLPQVKWSDKGEQATETQVDLRNNVIWNWRSVASQIWKGTRANIVANYYYNPNVGGNAQKRAIYFCHAKSKPPQCDGTKPEWFARAYIADNVSGHGTETTAYLNNLGTESKPFAAPSVETSNACTAAQQVLANAGARPLDAGDAQYIAQVTLPGS